MYKFIILVPPTPCHLLPYQGAVFNSPHACWTQ